MEILSILADIALESTKWLPSREIDKKKIRAYGSLLLSIAMVLGIGLSSFFVIDAFHSGLLFKFYLWIGLGINAITALSVGFIIARLWAWESNAHIQESEEFLKSELRSVIAIFLLSLVPGLHILFLPRVIANASNIFEYAGNTPETMRYGKVASNLIAISAFVILTYTLMIGICLIIAGDTRRVR